MSPLWLAVPVGLLLLLRGRGKPAKDYSSEEAIEALPAGVVVRSSLSGAGTIRVSSRLGGVVYRYAGKDRKSEEMNPRMALLLVRLGEYLERRYGVMAIDHYGIFPGSSDKTTDSHNRGVAADLAVFHFRDGSKLSVLKDWGEKPRTGPGYRLRPSDPGYRFFQDVYDFLSYEGEGGGRIGEPSYVVTPDHHKEYLRNSHRDHFHVQLDKIN